MFLIGLTGGIGSGKSTVARYFSELGITVIDADVIAREIVASNSDVLNKITTHFGPTILDNAGHLRRDKLRDLIFAQPLQREWLENLLHPLILEEMYQQAKAAHSPYCILEIPLLIEKNVAVDRVLVVDSPLDHRIERLKTQRPGMSENQITAILKIQSSQEEKLAKADDVIQNSGTLVELQQKVKQLHQHYVKIAHLEK